MSVLTCSNGEFLLDGKPYRVLSGTVHYFRVPCEYWRDRLQKLRECGLNTVETYTCWNLHERREGEFDFSGMLDIERFVSTAEELGLNVILRPGPYICAEWEWGGMPSWLLRYPDMKRRCYDELFLEKLGRYYRELFRRLLPHMASRGGAIFMVQIENEYGSYGDDKKYLAAIAELYRECGVDCLLFTSDGPSDVMLQGGTLEPYLAAVNFGSKPDAAFGKLREFYPDSPLFCAEFWCGWFDHWYEKHHLRGSDDASSTFARMLDLDASVNIYVFCGGTNFGFTSGANYSDKYEPTVTSYDYNAPLTEAGDLTDKYFEIRGEIEKRFGTLPPLTVKNTPKAAYGDLELTGKAELFDNLDALSEALQAPQPLTMEEMGQDFGFALYTATLRGPVGEKRLVLDTLRDRALVWLDGKLAGLCERSRSEDEIRLRLGRGDSVRVDILVENMGRVNYGRMLAGERKGILGGVLLDGYYRFGWECRALPMEDLSRLEYRSSVTPGGCPCFLRGELELRDAPCDTFVRLDGFTKGFVCVNGHNLGRYWNAAGPQRTLYLPAPFLREGKNEVVVFELEGYEKPRVCFTDTPEL